MNSVDKNDVDISALFNWGGRLDVLDMKGEVIFYAFVRLVGDADMNIARVFALRESAKLRKKLRTKGSEEREAYLPDNTVIDKEKFVELLTAMSVSDITAKVVRGLEISYPKEPPSDASIEEQEKYQATVDDWPNVRRKMIAEAVDKALVEERKRLSKLTKETLVREFEKIIIDKVCEDVMMKKFTDMCIFLGTYADENYQIKLFENFEEYENLPLPVKGQFTDFYAALDIDMNDLKK